MKTLCVGYVVALTFLLLGEQPLHFLEVPASTACLLREFAPLAHGVSFFLLTVVVLAARWPVSRLILVLFLASYALATEILQGLVPARTPELVDMVRNLGGIVAGAAVWWLGWGAFRAVGRRLAGARPVQPDAARASWESLLGMPARATGAEIVGPPIE